MHKVKLFIFSLFLSFGLSVSAMLLHAAPASATSANDSAPASVSSLAELETAISRITSFAEYQTYAAAPDSTALPFSKEYAHLRSLVTEMTAIRDQYSAVASSASAWKISYLIEYSSEALRGCEYIFGIKRAAAQAAQNSVNSPSVASSNPDTTSIPASSSAPAASSSNSNQRNSVQSSTPAPTTIAANSLTSSTYDAVSTASTPSASENQSSDEALDSSPLSANSAADPDQSQSTPDSEAASDNAALASAAAHATTAFSGACALLYTKRRLS